MAVKIHGFRAVQADSLNTEFGLTVAGLPGRYFLQDKIFRS